MGAGLGTTGEPGWALVVAEDATRRMALFHLLEWAGHRATVAGTAREALTLLEAEPFDLVLLDAMAGSGAGEVLRRISADPGPGSAPVLMVVPEVELETVGSWLAMGADDVVTEPLVAVVVRARVNTTLARKRLADRVVEHHRVIGRIVEAVVAARDGTLEGSCLTAIARCDPRGRLGPALRQIAAERPSAAPG